MREKTCHFFGMTLSGFFWSDDDNNDDVDDNFDDHMTMTTTMMTMTGGTRPHQRARGFRLQQGTPPPHDEPFGHRRQTQALEEALTGTAMTCSSARWQSSNEAMCDVGRFNNFVVASAARQSLTCCLVAIGTKCI